MIIAPCTLEGAHVRMEPLTLEHSDALAAIGCREELWRWTTIKIRTPEEMRSLVQSALTMPDSLPFATIDKASGRVAGSTRFLNISTEHRRAEIGFTWLAPEWQRTALNTEAKYLMLRHGFEQWKCIRMELKTNALNLKSRQAILRIGAKEEGIFRQHMINSDGSLRDSVYYSILDSEWPQVKARLEEMLSV